MQNYQYLKPSDLPKNLRKLFDYQSQIVKYIEERKKNTVVINQQCISCNVIWENKVQNIRQAIKKNNLTGMCRKCWAKQPKHYSVGAKSANWKGGIRKMPNGYVMKRNTSHPNNSNGYVLEHRLVMEKDLGRYLLPKETVHHKNGIKSDNRIENLELRGRNHGTGSRYKDWTNQQISQLISHLQTILEERSD